jgi:hypothetical protein
MSATFVCPHCGASYPRKPVLVGRPVRCTTCKNAFRLREDGIADKVEMAEPAPATAAAAPSPVAAAPLQAVAPPAPVPRPEPLAKPSAPKLQSTGWGLDLDVEVEEPAPARSAPPPAAAAAPPAAKAPPPAVIPTPAPGAGRKSERMTAQQMEARRAMAATLSTSMSAALKSEAVKREDQAGKAKAKTEGRVGQIGPAVFTGQGVEEARDRRRLVLGVLVAGLVIAGLWWLLFTDSPQRAGLMAYTAEVDPTRIRSGERVQAIQQRAWLTGLPPAYVGAPPMIDMNDARIGSTRTLNFAPAKDLLVSLKGLEAVDPGPVWVPPERVAAVEELRRPDQKTEAFIAAVLKREKKAISHPELLDRLAKATGMQKEDAEVVDLLLRGRTAADGSNAIAKRWLDGDVPQSLQLVNFTGSRGLLLLSRGQNFKTAEVGYRGRLLRFNGPGWPEEWKVLTIQTELRQKF